MNMRAGLCLRQMCYVGVAEMHPSLNSSQSSVSKLQNVTQAAGELCRLPQVVTVQRPNGLCFHCLLLGLCLLMLPATVLLQHTVGSKDVATADQVSITSVVVTCWPPRFLWDYFWFIKTDSSWCLKAQCSTVHCSCVRPLWCLTQRQTTPCIPLVDGRFFPWSW